MKIKKFVDSRGNIFELDEKVAFTYNPLVFGQIKAFSTNRIRVVYSTGASRWCKPEEINKIKETK